MMCWAMGLGGIGWIARVARGLERHGLAAAPASVAWDGVGPAKERGERVRAWSGAECWVLSGWSRRAAYPKWPCPGTRFMKLLVNGSYRRCGPMKHVALLVEPCLVGGGWEGVRGWVPKLWRVRVCACARAVARAKITR